MKTAIFVLAILLGSFETATAQTVTGFMEGQFQVVDGRVSPTMDVSISHPLKSGWSVDTWALKCDGWGEAYIGLTKSVTSWASVTGQVGFEQADSPWRIAGTLWMGGRGMSLLAIYEHGGSGWWHKIVASHQITKAISAGVMSQRFVGTGPYVEVSAKKMKLWVSVPVVDGSGVLVGVRVGY